MNSILGISGVLIVDLISSVKGKTAWTPNPDIHNPVPGESFQKVANTVTIMKMCNYWRALMQLSFPLFGAARPFALTVNPICAGGHQQGNTEARSQSTANMGDPTVSNEDGPSPPKPHNLWRLQHISHL